MIDSLLLVNDSGGGMCDYSPMVDEMVDEMVNVILRVVRGLQPNNSCNDCIEQL